MTAAEIAASKLKLTELAMELIASRGSRISKTDLAAESRMSRARIDEIFPEEGDLIDAIAEHWYVDDIADMEDVVASNLPIRRKFFEFYSRRFQRELAKFRKDPALFALYLELGSEYFERIRGYIDLADHYLCELIAEAQEEGYFAGLPIDRALTLINQMTTCYTSPQVMMMFADRLADEKLAVIIDTIFEGLSAKDQGTAGISGLHTAN